MRDFHSVLDARRPSHTTCKTMSGARRPRPVTQPAIEGSRGACRWGLAHCVGRAMRDRAGACRMHLYLLGWAPHGNGSPCRDYDSVGLPLSIDATFAKADTVLLNELNKSSDYRAREQASSETPCKSVFSALVASGKSFSTHMGGKSG
jgi:hypothetical protein